MIMAGSVLQGEGFSVSFSNREVTAWGGLALFKPMLDSLRFGEAAAGWGLPEPKSNRGYAPLQLIEQFIVSIWCGACRFAHAETARMDSTLVRLFGWTKAAGHKAIMRLFAHRRFVAPGCQPEPPDALRAPSKTRLVLRTLGQRFRSACHSGAAKWLMDNLGSRQASLMCQRAASCFWLR